MDLGTPQAYLQAQFDLLDGRGRPRPYPSPFVDTGGRIDRGATVNEHVVVGPRATIETGARERRRPARAGGGRTRHGRRAIDPRPRLEGDARVGHDRARRGGGGGADASVREGRRATGERVEA